MNDKQLNLFEGSWPLSTTVLSEFPNDEYSELEYKAAAGGFPQSIFETYSAFANTDGGFIVLGVAEKKGHVNVEGLDEKVIPKYIQEFWNALNNKKKVSKNICSNNDVKEIGFDGKKLLCFRIPAAKRTEKPIYLNNNPIGNTFKRNHEGDYKCADDEVKRMLADADISHHHDNRILTGYSLDDVDLDSLRKYRQFFSAAKQGHIWLTLSDMELLQKIGGYRKDRESGKEGFTVAGILMFGKTNSITDPECAPNFFPDYREILTTDPDIRWTDRIYPDGTWEVNLFQFYLRVWPRLVNNLPKPFQIKDGRRNDETSAHVALREAFVNSLIHANYTAPGNIIIHQNSDKYSFTNPGTLLVTLFQYYNGGISECRNPIIQKMFLMIGIAEKAGSGVNKILAGWNDAHWRTPKLSIDKSPERVTLELLMLNMIPSETIDELHEIFGDIELLSKDELTALALCHLEGEVSNSKLQFVLNKHSYDVTRMLQELSRKNYIVPDNKGRWTTYHINTEFLSNIRSLNVGTNDPNVDTNDPNVDISDPTIGLVESTNINKKVKKLSKEELDKLVLESCAVEYKTAEEIAHIVNRNVDYIKNLIIPRLVKSKRIKRLYEYPRHKKQAYLKV